MNIPPIIVVGAERIRVTLSVSVRNACPTRAKTDAVQLACAA